MMFFRSRNSAVITLQFSVTRTRPLVLLVAAFSAFAGKQDFFPRHAEETVPGSDEWLRNLSLLFLRASSMNHLRQSH